MTKEELFGLTYWFFIAFGIGLVPGVLFLFFRKLRDQLVRKIEDEGKRFSKGWNEKYDTPEKVKIMRKNLHLGFRITGVFFILWGLFLLFIAFNEILGLP